MKKLMYGGSLGVLLMAAGIAGPAIAAAAAAADSESVSEVIVTGTRATGVKAIDSAAPIQVVGSGALKQVGQPDLIQALAQNLPSFNAESIGGDTGNLTLSAALRGLNPNDTLILVDGKRRNPTGNLHVDGSAYQGAATADLSFIPVGAIDHIEVLQDGAAAQYGSDAIAGVVNIILKTSDHAGVFTGTGGQYYEGDGNTGAWSFNKGFQLGPDGFVNVTAEERYHDFSLPNGGIDRRVQNPNGSPKASDNAIDAAGLPGATAFPNVNQINSDAQYNIYNFFYNAGYNLGAGVQLYSFGSYGYRTASAYENYRVPSKVISSPTLGDPGSVTTPGELVPVPHGFDPREALVENEYSFTGGARGNVDGWRWDLSSTYGEDNDVISTINSANLSLFVDTHFTPTNFRDGVFDATQWTTNLDIDREFNLGLASPLNVAMGAEARRDTFGISSGDPASIFAEGGQSFPGFQPTDAGDHRRNAYAGYLDFSIDPIAGLHVDLAGRYETYSDFGDTEVGKVTVRYDFNPMFAIRGTISSGFRAPTLAEEYYSATNVAPTFAVVQLPANSAAAQQMGFGHLRPELSNNYSIGFVAHPIEKMQVTADFYEIDINDRIVATGTLLGQVGSDVVSPAVLSAIAAHGNKLDPTGLSYVGVSVFTNAASTRTRGAEVTATYASDFDEYGHVDWSVGFNYNETDVLHQSPLPSAVAVPGLQTSILGPTALALLTTATPREKVVLGAYWTLSKWSVNLRETVYGDSSLPVSFDGTGNSTSAGFTEEKIGVTPITDLDIGYNLTRSIKLDIGANNLFNFKPPTVPNQPDGSGGIRPADGSNVYNAPLGFSPFGIDGG
ncbi:MAG TPA: TonB-dependent receptor [Caulobacteraceae bacterium]|nr:TonB-dependent receptor [Caulobacteraceae bacterium]